MTYLEMKRMKAIPTNQQSPHRIVVVNNHQYQMSPKMYLRVLTLARSKYRNDKQNAIYAITKGNITQMVDEPYNSLDELKQAVIKYKCKGFSKVHYYIAV